MSGSAERRKDWREMDAGSSHAPDRERKIQAGMIHHHPGLFIWRYRADQDARMALSFSSGLGSTSFLCSAALSGTPSARAINCVKNSTGMGWSKPIWNWRASRLVWHNGQATAMASAPAARAWRIRLLLNSITMSGRVSEWAAPQQLVLNDHSTTSAPSARSRSSIWVGFSGWAAPVTRGGRVSRQP